MPKDKIETKRRTKKWKKKINKTRMYETELEEGALQWQGRRKTLVNSRTKC